MSLTKRRPGAQMTPHTETHSKKPD